MADVLQPLLGLLVLIGFWRGVFAVIRHFQPSKPRRVARPVASRPDRRQGPRASGSAASPPRPVSDPGFAVPATVPRAQAVPCCPDCVPGCQVTGLAMGQAWGRGDDWWGQPFGDDGPNPEAMVFWGDDCCPDCAQCPICQGG